MKLGCSLGSYTHFNYSKVERPAHSLHYCCAVLKNTYFRHCHNFVSQLECFG